MTVCLNCNANENEKPLLSIKFQGNEIYICPQCLPVLIHKPDKIPLRVSSQCGFTEVLVLAYKIGRAAMHICEIAAPATRDTDFFTRCLGVINHDDTRPGMGGTHHTRGPGANDQSLDIHQADVARINRWCKPDQHIASTKTARVTNRTIGCPRYLL